MCVSQFREYCNVSEFVTDGEQYNYTEDMANPLVQVRGWKVYYDLDNQPYYRYYRTDLREMVKLAKTGNTYAINHVANIEAIIKPRHSAQHK